MMRPHFKTKLMSWVFVERGSAWFIRFSPAVEITLYKRMVCKIEKQKFVNFPSFKLTMQIWRLKFKVFSYGWSIRDWDFRAIGIFQCPYIQQFKIYTWEITSVQLLKLSASTISSLNPMPNFKMTQLRYVFSKVKHKKQCCSPFVSWLCYNIQLKGLTILL